MFLKKFLFFYLSARGLFGRSGQISSLLEESGLQFYTILCFDESTFCDKFATGEPRKGRRLGRIIEFPIENRWLFSVGFPNKIDDYRKPFALAVSRDEFFTKR